MGEYGSDPARHIANHLSQTFSNSGSNTCDVAIHNGIESSPADSVVLACASFAVRRFMLADRDIDALIIPGFDQTTVATVLRLFYNGHVQLKRSGLQELSDLLELLEFEFDVSVDSDEPADPKATDHIDVDDIALSDVEVKEDTALDEAKEEAVVGDAKEAAGDDGSSKSEEEVLDMQTTLKLLSGSELVANDTRICCGICNIKVRVTKDRTPLGILRYFENHHYRKCLDKHPNMERRFLHDILEIAPAGHDRKVYDFDEDCLPTVLANAAKHGKPGRNSVPDEDSVRQMLADVGGSRFVENGARIHCGVCGRRLKVPRRRPILGIIQYFKHYHFDRQHGKMKQEAPPRDNRRLNVITSLMKRDRELPSSRRAIGLFGSLVCFFCETKQAHGEALVKHVKKQHPNQVPVFPCDICVDDILFESYDDLRKHLEKSHNIRESFSCSLCSQDFETQQHLNSHYDSEHPGNTQEFSCDECSAVFPSFSLLKSHIKRQHMISKENFQKLTQCYRCRICDVEVADPFTLYQHFIANHSESLRTGKPFTCTFCDNHQFDFFDELTHHLGDVHSATPVYLCRLCDHKPFVSRGSYFTHFRTDHPQEKPYSCPRCPSTFRDVAKHKQHLQTHKKLQIQFKCRFCEKNFGSRARLNEHVKEIHLQSDMLKCKVCGKILSSKYALQTHLNVHSGLKSFLCNHCGKGFCRKESLTSHVKVVHDGSKQHVCDICDKRFSNSYKLKRHLNSHQNALVENEKRNENQLFTTMLYPS